MKNEEKFHDLEIELDQVRLSMAEMRKDNEKLKAMLVQIAEGVKKGQNNAPQVQNNQLDAIALMKEMAALQREMKKSIVDDINLAKTLMDTGAYDHEETDETDDMFNEMARGLLRGNANASHAQPAPQLPPSPAPSSPDLMPKNEVIGVETDGKA
jgi:hypothetical protein